MRSKKQHPNKVLAKNKSTEKFTSYIQVEKPAFDDFDNRCVYLAYHENAANPKEILYIQLSG